MKKIYLFMLLLFATVQLPAQVLVQGRPHPTAAQVVMTRAIADGTFTMDMIENWTGEGSNRAALAIQWNVDGEETALVWGFRWDGEATGATMITAIAAADPRFALASESGTAFGNTVSGIGYDMNSSGNFAITKDGETLQANEQGLIPMSGYSYDGWSCTDPEDYWQSGWYQGYWSYWTRLDDSDSWEYSGLGVSARELTDGCWDGWNFAADMQSYDWKPLAPAAKNGLAESSVKTQPESVVVSPGEPVAFVPEFRGDSLTFQWYKNRVPINGAISSTYTIASAATGDAGSYYCLAGNRLGYVSTDTVSLVVGEKPVVAMPGEAPHTAVVIYDDSYATFSGALTIPSTVEIGRESYTVTAIGDMAFMGCVKLTSVLLPATVQTIGEGAFYGCTGLTDMVLPESVSAIGAEAFGDCTALASLTANENLKTIGRSAFAGCTALTAVALPDGVTTLGASAFYGCSALQSAELGTGVKALESNLFKNNTSLTRVVVNGAIASVANYTFGGCSALESLYINSALPSGASSNTFDKVPESCKIYVPAESCGDYAEANYWKAFDIQPWLTQLSIVSTAPEMTLDGGELLEIDGKTTTFAITFNRSLVEADAVTARLKQGDTELAGQTFSLSSEGAVLTLVREGEELPTGDYTLVLTTSTATLRISFRVATPTGIEGVGADKVVLTREYYSVDGKRLSAPVPGINLVKVVYDDHSVEVLKVFVNTDLRR